MRACSECGKDIWRAVAYEPSPEYCELCERLELDSGACLDCVVEAARKLQSFAPPASGSPEVER